MLNKLLCSYKVVNNFEIQLGCSLFDIGVKNSEQGTPNNEYRRAFSQKDKPGTGGPVYSKVFVDARDKPDTGGLCEHIASNLN